MGCIILTWVRWHPEYVFAQLTYSSLNELFGKTIDFMICITITQNILDIYLDDIKFILVHTGLGIE